MSPDAGQHHPDIVPPPTVHGTPARTPHTEVVTSVIHHQVKAGEEASYEAWVREITPAAQRFPGHLGVDILQPPQGAGLYTIVLRFDTLEHMDSYSAGFHDLGHPHDLVR